MLFDDGKPMLQSHIDELIRWLERMECSIHNHRNTEEHKEAVRKSGSHRQSGLTATELELKTKLATLEKEKARAKKLGSNRARRMGGQRTTTQKADYSRGIGAAL